MQKKEIDKMLMFPTKEGAFKETIGLIKESVSYDPAIRLRISTTASYDGSVMTTFTTENGVTAKVAAADGSERFETDIVVFANEFCAACDVTLVDDDDAILCGMSVVDGKLFVFGFLAEGSDEFNFECGLDLQPEDSVQPVPELNVDETLSVGQLDMAMVGDSTYGFPCVEMHRKNGVLSFRVGDKHFCMATVFNNQAQAAAGVGETPRDFAFRLPSSVFTVLAKVKIDLTVNMEIDFAAKRLCVADGDMRVAVPMQDSEVETFNSVGLNKFATVPGNGLVMSIAHMRKILPATTIELRAGEDNTMMVVAKTDRVDFSFTVRECEVYAPGSTFEMPFDVFVRTVIMSSGATVDWSVSDDGKSKFIAFFNNGLMSRKCTYSM